MQSAEQALPEPPSRDELLRHLRSSGSSPHISRAIIEVGLLIDTDLELQQELVRRYLTAGETMLGMEMLIVLSHSRTLRPSVVIEAYAGTTNDRVSALWSACLLLAGLPDEDGEAALFMRGVLESEELSEETEVLVRAALANVGHRDGDNVATIKAHLAKQTDAGCGAMEVIALCGAGEWVDDEVIALLKEYLSASGEVEDKQAMAAIALGAIGPRAASAKAALEQRLTRRRRFRSDDNANELFVYYMALAQIDPARSRNHLRAAFRTIMAGFSRTSNACMLYASLTMDDEMVERVIGLIDDRSDLVAKGALRQLYNMPFSARHAVPRVLEVLQSRRSEQVRGDAAYVLVVLGDTSLVPRLREIGERTPDTLSELEYTISVLTFDESLR